MSPSHLNLLPWPSGDHFTLKSLRPHNKFWRGGVTHVVQRLLWATLTASVSISTSVPCGMSLW
jgi:hypothetical protein